MVSIVFQLLCLARSLLRGSAVLLMDEATSSVDLYTDQVIQTVIHTAFKQKTVVTVAVR